MNATMSQHMGRYSTAKVDCQNTLTDVFSRVGGTMEAPLSELARLCGFSIPTVASVIHKMEDDGQVVIESGRPNKYHLFGDKPSKSSKAKVVTLTDDEVLVIKHV